MNKYTVRLRSTAVVEIYTEVEAESPKDAGLKAESKAIEDISSEDWRVNIITSRPNAIEAQDQKTLKPYTLRQP